MIKISDEHWHRIQKYFPEEKIPEGRPGRKPVPARQIVDAVLWILTTGAQWAMLPQSYPNYKTVHRRFQKWCQQEILRNLLKGIANELREREMIDTSEGYIDATFVSGRCGGLEIGKTKWGKGMKIMATVDRTGLPLSVSTHAAKTGWMKNFPQKESKWWHHIAKTEKNQKHKMDVNFAVTNADGLWSVFSHG